jgi:hypothetical protein
VKLSDFGMSGKMEHSLDNKVPFVTKLFFEVLILEVLLEGLILEVILEVRIIVVILEVLIIEIIILTRCPL